MKYVLNVAGKLYGPFNTPGMAVNYYRKNWSLVLSPTFTIQPVYAP